MAKKDELAPTRQRLLCEYCESRGWRNADGTWHITAIHEATGKAKTKISDLLNGKGPFGPVIARDLERAFDLPEGYFDGRPAENPDYEDVTHLDVKLAAGDGHIAGYEEAIGSLKFKGSFLRACGVKAKTAKVVDVHGHSMHPTIPDGAVVLIDLTSREPVEGKVFALARPTEGLVIKRLTYESGRWIATSDNPSGDRFPIDNGEEMKIIGKAVWFGVKL